jgi:hypothetical protein
MAEWLGMVKDVGFPIVVTLYLLHRIENKLDELNASILALPGRLLDTSGRQKEDAG